MRMRDCALGIATLGLLLTGCADEITRSGPPGDLRLSTSPVSPIEKRFYAWTDSYTSPRDGIRLQGKDPNGQDESYDRQFVWAGNCEKTWKLDVDDAGFVERNKGTGMFYIIGDKPDMPQSTENCY